MAGKASPQLLIKQRRTRVFELLKIRATKEQIMGELERNGYKTSERTYARDLETIRDKASEWVDSFADDSGLVTEYMLVIESLKEQVRKLLLIQAEAVRPYDRLMASQLVADTEKAIFDMLLEGPAMWAIKRKLEAKPVPE